MPTTANKAKFDAFLKTREVSAWLFDFDVAGTKATYSSALYRYRSESLSKTYPTLRDWILAVKAQRKVKDDPVAQTAWATDVKTYMKSRRGLGGRPMATASRELLSSAVKSFLRKWVNPELDYDFKIGYTVEELRKKQNKPAISIEEMRKLYEACKTTRDRALTLVAVNGVTPAEMIQFTDKWAEWFPKNPNELVAPFRVNLVRGKKSVPYHVTLFEDACNALRSLYEERIQRREVELTFSS